MERDIQGWSGEGTFTHRVIDSLGRLDDVVFLRVEDSPATRSDVDYNFISNEIFLGFRTEERMRRSRWLRLLPRSRRLPHQALTLPRIEEVLAADEEIGRADYADESMLQYLRTERIVPPYQTRGYKLVELVRVFEVGTEPRRAWQ